ncbi:MAG: D-alanyl-D-alanine carboxypeptidase [Pseudomonadota bacterium]|nr:D-alanyl-D-alanine carboxypeptidase [Pseudomonadota bacterium]MBU1397482.1 D-alanyl-D-alanine carboxypeptidase [Pseudomonadota bacterium]MBU1571079.1 D-alanyl-D-alanine carboxypeptidase [Pseudomonadota bacterium]
MMNRLKYFLGCLIFSFFCLVLAAQNLPAGDNLSALGKLVGDKDAIVVADPGGRIIYEKNAGKKLIPASTLKLLTSLAALHYLGPEYRFATEFYMDKDSNLKVKGYGDPLLLSEVLIEISKTLGSRVKHINDLVLDDSYFKPATIPGVTSSLEPYDSPNGALCANFNTVNFDILKGKPVSAEPQTPLLPFALKKINKSSIKAGRILLSSEQNENTLYAGHLLSHFLEKEGIKPKGKIIVGPVRQETDRLILKYLSPFSIEDIISRLLLHSNNFIANQIVLAISAKISGQPGTLDKGVLAISDFAVNNLKIDDLTIVEGSGISRENRISAKSFLKILAAFEPHLDLMKHNGNEYYKTGTLSGISTRAGYIKGRDGRLYKFIIMTNSNGNYAEKISRKLCGLIE